MYLQLPVYDPRLSVLQLCNRVFLLWHICGSCFLFCFLVTEQHGCAGRRCPCLFSQIVNHSQAHRLADLPFWSHSPPSINNPAHRENRDKTIHHRSYLSFLLLFMFAQCSLSISSPLIILIKEAHTSIEFPLHTKTTRREECSREGTTFHLRSFWPLLFILFRTV